jgi:hypothetical protein
MAGGLLAGLGVWFLSLPSPAAMVPQPEPKPAGQNGRPVKERRGVTAAAASTAVPAATGEGNLTFKRALERLSYGSRA